MWHKLQQALPTYHIWLIYVEQSLDDAKLTRSRELGSIVSQEIIMKSNYNKFLTINPVCHEFPSMN